MLGTWFSHLPRTAENAKHCSELKLRLVGFHRGNTSNTRMKFSTRNQDHARAYIKKEEETTTKSISRSLKAPN